MNKTSTLTLSIIALGLAIGSLFIKTTEKGIPSLLGTANEIYSATTTDSLWASTFLQGKQIKIGTGVLGSVIIGNATAVGTLTLYDATTTTNGAIYGTTTLAVINTGTPGSTLTYNVAFSRGLLAVMSNTLATSTIIFD